MSPKVLFHHFYCNFGKVHHTLDSEFGGLASLKEFCEHDTVIMFHLSRSHVDSASFPRNVNVKP